MRALHRLVLPMMLLAAACSAGTEASGIYGAWRLVEVRGDPAPNHVVGEILQLTPDARAIYQGEGVKARQVPFETFRGLINYPEPGKPAEGVLLTLQDETVTFEVRMPTRSTLILVPNDIYGPTLTYRRAR